MKRGVAGRTTKELIAAAEHLAALAPRLSSAVAGVAIGQQDQRAVVDGLCSDVYGAAIAVRNLARMLLVATGGDRLVLPPLDIQPIKQRIAEMEGLRGELAKERGRHSDTRRKLALAKAERMEEKDSPVPQVG